MRKVQPTVYAEDVVAAEFRHLGFWRRMVLRWVSRDLHDAARHLSVNPRGYVNVAKVSPKGPFDSLVTDAADRWLEGSGRR